MVWLWNRHKPCQRLLSAYVDGQVTEPERRTVEEHLSGCGPCTSDLEELRATVALLRALPELPVPRSFALEQAPVLSVGGTGLLRAARLATAVAGSLSAAVLAGALMTGLFTGSADEAASAQQTSADRPAAAAEVARVAAPPAAETVPQAAAAPTAPPMAMSAAAPTAPAQPKSGEAEVPQPAAAALSIAEAEETPTPTASPTPTPTLTPSPTATPAPAEGTPLAFAPTPVADEADDTRQEKERRTGLSWQIPAALGGLLVVFAASTGWLTILIRRRSR